MAGDGMDAGAGDRYAYTVRYSKGSLVGAGGHILDDIRDLIGNAYIIKECPKETSLRTYGGLLVFMEGPELDDGAISKLKRLPTVYDFDTYKQLSQEEVDFYRRLEDSDAWRDAHPLPFSE